MAKEQKTAPPPPSRGLLGLPDAEAPVCVVIQTYENYRRGEGQGHAECKQQVSQTHTSLSVQPKAL